MSSNVCDIFALRILNKDWKDAVDNFSENVWTRLLAHGAVYDAFHFGNVFIVDRVCRQIATNRSVFLNAELEALFIMNTFHDIDVIMVRYGYIESINRERPVFVDKKTGETVYQETPLIRACQRKDYARIRFLLENGADPNSYYSASSMSPFELLVKDADLNDEEFVDVLNTFLAGRHLKLFPAYALKSLEYLVGVDNTILFRKVFEYWRVNTDPNTIAEWCSKTLIKVVKRKAHPDVIRLLVKLGANVSNNSTLLASIDMTNPNALDNMIFLMENGAKFSSATERANIMKKLANADIQPGEQASKYRKIVSLASKMTFR